MRLGNTPSTWVPPPRHGGVLVIVLLAVALLLSIVISAATAVRLRWALADDTLRRGQARDAALSAIASALHALVTDTNALDTLDEPWADPQESGGLALSDEESRIHLPTADAPLLTALFVRMAGVPRAVAVPLAENTVAWRNSRSSPPSAVEQFRSVPGMSDDLLARLLPHTTVRGSGKVNINTVDEALLGVLLDGAGTGADTAQGLCAGLRRARRTGVVAPDASPATLAMLLVGENRIPAPAQAQALAALSRRLDVRSTAFRGVATASASNRPTPSHAIGFIFDRTSSTFVQWWE